MIRERYQISYGLQHGAWELAVRLPDWEEYRTEEEARKISERRTVSALLTADAIFLYYGGLKTEILPQQQELYRFSFLKEDAYERLGPPLSPEDLDRLVEKGMLEEVIFSSRYMLTENDYAEFPGTLSEAFLELKQAGEPVFWEKDGSRGQPGYLFESIWYQVERIR